MFHIFSPFVSQLEISGRAGTNFGVPAIFVLMTTLTLVDESVVF